MNYSKIQSDAESLHAKACQTKRTKINTAGGAFYLEYSPYFQHFKSFDENGNEGPSFNTRKISDAKKWIKEYFLN